MAKLSTFTPMWRKISVAGAALALIASVGVSAAPIAATAHTTQTAGVSTQNADDTLRIATAATIDSFNPFTSVYLLPTNVNRYVYENLVQYDAKDGSPTKGLADSWSTSADSKTWTFTLQNGLVWSDGKPITSADVKWTFDQMMTNEAMAAANGSLVSNFASVAAPDEKTVVITLKEPQAPNPGTEIPIVPKHIWEGIKNPAEFANDKDVVGSGPFTLKSFKANQSVELIANPKFWRGAPKLSGIRYTYYTNTEAQLQALKAGEVDMVTGLTQVQAKTLESDKTITVNRGEGRRFTGIGLNHGMQTPKGEAYGDGNAALKELPVREAIRLGINTPVLLREVLGDFGTVATSFIPSAFQKWHLPDSDPAVVKFDPAAAKAKLDAAGWAVGADGIRVKNGAKLQLRLLTDADSAPHQAMAEFITAWMKDIGIAIKVESSDGDTISDRTEKGNYDLYISGWSVNPDPDYQLGLNTCASRPDKDGKGPTSQDGFCDPAYDALYVKQHSELDEAKRIELVRQMQELHYKYVPSVTLWYPKSLEAYRADKFTGFTLQPSEGGAIAFQAGYWGYYTVAPVSASSAAAATGANAGSTTAAKSDDSGSNLLVTGGIAVVALAAIGGVVFAVRRRKSSDDRE